MPDGGKAPGQGLSGTLCGRQSPHAVGVIYCVLADLPPVKEGSVDMGVDHAGRDGEGTQVNDFASLGGSSMRPHLQNFVAFNEDLLPRLEAVLQTVIELSAEKFGIRHDYLLNSVPSASDGADGSIINEISTQEDRSTRSQRQIQEHPGNNEDGPNDKEAEGVRNHHGNDVAHTKLFIVLGGHADDHGQVGVDGGDGIGAGISDAVDHLGKLWSETQHHEHGYKNGSKDVPLCGTAGHEEVDEGGNQKDS